MPDNNRLQVCDKLSELKQKIAEIRASCDSKELARLPSPQALGQLSASLDSALEQIGVLETMLRPGERKSRKNRVYKTPEGNPVLTIDIYNDLVARLGIEEIIKKYEIKSPATFYNHLKASSLKDVDLIKLKKDKRYQTVILSKLSKDGKDQEKF